MSIKSPKRRPKPEPITVSDVPGSFDSPESSYIHSATYDASTETLRVTFRSGEQPTYEYNKFELAKWLEFYEAVSKGKYFLGRIKPFYTGVLVSS